MSARNPERKTPANGLERWKQEVEDKRHRDAMLARWMESERILGILRSITSHMEPFNEEAISSWYYGVEKRSFDPLTTGVHKASLWFHDRFPEHAYRYGNAFLQESIGGGQYRPILLNTDFFAAMLGGEPALGHQVVFFPAENTFYFKDTRLNAFCPATPGKLQVLASNYLVKCAEACTNKPIMIALLDTFRRPDMLLSITQKAKIILEVEQSFFEGPHGRVRYIHGHRISPADEPGHHLFVQKALVSQPDATMTMSEAHCRYAEFCHREHLPTLASSSFRKIVPDLIDSAFSLRLRHDIPTAAGKQTHGWIGLACQRE